MGIGSLYRIIVSFTHLLVVERFCLISLK